MTGLQLSYDDLVTTLYLKGLSETDRQNIHKKFMSYNASYEEMAEMARSLEQSAVPLKTKHPESRGSINAITSASHIRPCTECGSETHSTSGHPHPKCTLCGKKGHEIQDCVVNPDSVKFKGKQYAKKFWKRARKRPPKPPAETAEGALMVAAI